MINSQGIPSTPAEGTTAGDADSAALIEREMTTTLLKSDLSDIGASFADAALDELPLPVFSALRKLYKGAKTVAQYFFCKKLLRLLAEIADVPPEVRSRRLEEALPSQDDKEKFGEHITLVLERLNDVGKATLMGRAAHAFLSGKINLEQLRSINFAIEAVNPRLLPVLERMVDSGHWTSESDMQSLNACGLLSLVLDLDMDQMDALDLNSSVSSSTPFVKSVRVTYQINEFTILFRNVCLPK
ncbi:hypothetical protein [Alienimonas californiensis]|uniref:Uncharacterized protein n=1 Tax=Alienimonas californiensis TaxID=2527989 RepID=A0A517P878_9PLAN|nr:hypothetical protein [Alienimonas californiensis]QDT15588.1 hypothetical protein CA12_16730 [Alienimonas californiensis]